MRKVVLMGEVSLDNIANGVTQKTLSQAKAFQEMGAQVDCIGYSEGAVVAYRFEDGNFHRHEMLAQIKNAKIKRFPLWVSIRKYIKKNEYDLAYIRYPIIDFFVVRALRAIRKSCDNVVIEIPSYPLEIENATTIRKCLYALDTLLHNKCQRYVDRIIYIGNQTDTIFRCPAVQIPNGLPEQIKNISCSGYHINGNHIVLICVSNMHPFHGYDRLLNGLKEYYKEKHFYDIDVVLVGDGICREEYEKIVKESDLKSHVRFTGVLKGDELTAEYMGATIGVGSLGMYREGFLEASSLKTKEYLVRGLPFVYAVNEIGLDEKFPYALKVPNDDTPIQINDIVSFVDELKREPSDVVSKKMRRYAEEKFSWTTILQNACGDYINSMEKCREKK